MVGSITLFLNGSRSNFINKSLSASRTASWISRYIPFSTSLSRVSWYGLVSNSEFLFFSTILINSVFLF
ncbi:hypothetical protein ES703_66011 [subsurface metagenome]